MPAGKLLVEIAVKGAQIAARSVAQSANAMSASFGHLRSATAGIFSSTQKLVSAFVGLYALRRTVQIVGDVVSAYAEQEQMEARLAAALKNTAQYSDALQTQLLALADASQKLTGVADETVIAWQAQLATFRLTGKAIADLTPILTDVEAAGENVEGMIVAIGKAMATGTTTYLRRYGVLIDEAAFKQDRLGEVMRALESRFAGQAEAFGETLPGQIRKTVAAYDEFKESVGEDIAPMVKEGLDIITSLGKDESIRNGIYGMALAIRAVVIGAAELPKILPGLREVLGFLTGPLRLLALIGEEQRAALAADALASTHQRAKDAIVELRQALEVLDKKASAHVMVAGEVSRQYQDVVRSNLPGYIKKTAAALEGAGYTSEAARLLFAQWPNTARALAEAMEPVMDATDDLTDSVNENADAMERQVKVYDALGERLRMLGQQAGMGPQVGLGTFDIGEAYTMEPFQMQMRTWRDDWAETWDVWVSDATDAATNAANAIGAALDVASQRFAQMIVRGKADWKDFVSWMLEQFLAMMAKMAAFKLFNFLFSLVGLAAGGAGTAASGALPIASIGGGQQVVVPNVIVNVETGLPIMVQTYIGENYDAYRAREDYRRVETRHAEQTRRGYTGRTE